MENRTYNFIFENSDTWNKSFKVTISHMQKRLMIITWNQKSIPNILNIFLMDLWRIITQVTILLEDSLWYVKLLPGPCYHSVSYSKHVLVLSNLSHNVYLGVIEVHLILWFIVAFFVTFRNLISNYIFLTSC